MKIEFQENQSSDAPVSPQQTTMRNKKAKKWPVLRFLIAIILIGLLCATATYFYRSNNIYTYGLVSSEIQVVSAPFSGIVRNHTLQRGEHVKKGQVLLTVEPLASDDEKRAAEALRSELSGGREAIAFALLSEIKQAEQDVARLEAELSDESAKREHAIAMAEAEVDKLKSFLAAKADALNRKKILYNSDAALRSDVDAAQHEVNMAQYQVKQANIDLSLAASRKDPDSADLQKALEVLESKRKQPDALALRQAETEFAMAAAQTQPVQFKALFDSVVRESSTTKDTHVQPGEPLLSIASTENVWIDVYIPLNKTDKVFNGSKAEVYIHSAKEPILCNVVSAPVATTLVPLDLQRRFPTTPSAMYVRLGIPKEQQDTLILGDSVRVVIRSE